MGQSSGKQKIFFWLVTFVVFASLSNLFVGNLLSLPGTDRNSQAYTLGPGDLVYNQKGQLIQNPNGVDPVDVFHNIAKGLLLLIAAFALWRLTSMIVRRSWRRFVIFCVVGLLVCAALFGTGLLIGGDFWDGLAGGPLENTLLENYLISIGLSGGLLFLLLLIVGCIVRVFKKLKE